MGWYGGPYAKAGRSVLARRVQRARGSVASRRRRRGGTISGAAGGCHPLVNNVRWRAGEAPVPDSTARNS